MSGTSKGGVAAAKTNRERYGDDFYRVQGAKGGSTPSNKPKGFAHAAAHGLDWHREAGAKGGRISRRGSYNPEPKVMDVTPPKSILRRIFHGR